MAPLVLGWAAALLEERGHPFLVAWGADHVATWVAQEEDLPGQIDDEVRELWKRMLAEV